MSWISEIAGKAEEFLNNIDKNAASILKKGDKIHPSEEPVLSEVSTDTLFQNSKESKSQYSPSLINKMNPVRMTRSAHSSPSMNTRHKEEDLINFLNNSAAIEIDQLQMSSPKDVISNGHNEKSIEDLNEEIAELTNENFMLKNEVRSLNGELTLLLNRTKTAEKGVALTGERLSNTEKDVARLEKESILLNDKLKKTESRCKQLDCENQRLIELNDQMTTNQHNQVTTMNSESLLVEYKAKAIQREKELMADILALKSRLEKSDQDLSRVRTEKAGEVADLNFRLSEAKTKLEQYRIRAQKTLNEKDKLISELRKVGTCQESEDVLSIELEQLRNEKSREMEECEELRYKLELSQSQFVETERHLESLRDETMSSIKRLEERLAEETAQRIAAEENSNARTEEVALVRAELMELRGRVREKEAEVGRLRGQLVRTSSQDRVSSLTSALVRKQAALEAATKLSSDLKFELDQTKNKFRDYVSQVQGRTINVNDTDDAKLQVPSFFLESPFDTGVTRRVKRAYSSLDAVSIRTGVFLRRYPLARIFVLCYVICLQLWVCVILFSNTPETKL